MLWLSPVQTVDYFWVPAYQARVMTKGRRPSAAFSPS